MNTQTSRQIGIVVCAALAYACFTLMDSYPDYSRPQDILQIAGYVLCGAALYFVFKFLQGRKT